MKLTIYNLVTDTDNGTDTWSYASREEAEDAYIQLINTYLDEPVDTFDEAQEAYVQICDEGCIDSIGIDEQTIELGPKPPAEGLRRFYVVKAWEDFPEGGTCGEIIWAKDHDDAEAQMIEIMTSYRDDDDTYREDWHTIDCWPLDDFIERQLQAA